LLVFKWLPAWEEEGVIIFSVIVSLYTLNVKSAEHIYFQVYVGGKWFELLEFLIGKREV
jgi:hypothetical protein